MEIESGSNPLRIFRTEILIRCFSGQIDDIYRTVHFFDHNAFFFSKYPKYFFSRIYKLVITGKIKEVKRLLIFSAPEDKNSILSQRIINFHSTTKGYNYKCMKDQDYWKLQARYDIHPYTDIGIFGKRILYRARFDKPDRVIGTWTKKQEEIMKYIHFFEECWDSDFATRNPYFEQEPRITIENLFNS